MAQFTIAALTTEIQTDPKALGYAALVAAHDRIGVAAALNTTYAGVGTVWRTDMKASEVLAALVESEVSALSATSWARVQTLLIPPTIDASQVTIRNQFSGIFAGKTQTLAGLNATGQKASPSRAEELWGYRTVITEQNVADAGF